MMISNVNIDHQFIFINATTCGALRRAAHNDCVPLLSAASFRFLVSLVLTHLCNNHMLTEIVGDHRLVSQMRAPLAACSEPVRSYDRLGEVLYVFEDKTHFLIHVPQSRIVVF